MGKSGKKSKGATSPVANRPAPVASAGRRRKGSSSRSPARDREPITAALAARIATTNAVLLPKTCACVMVWKDLTNLHIKKLVYNNTHAKGEKIFYGNYGRFLCDACGEYSDNRDTALTMKLNHEPPPSGSC